MTLKFKESLSRKGTFKKDIKKDLEEAKKKTNKNQTSNSQDSTHRRKAASMQEGAGCLPGWKQRPFWLQFCRR